MPFISNKLSDNTILNINNYNNYENTNRITICIDNTTNFLDFYFPKTTLKNKKENLYDVENMNNYTIIKIKNTNKCQKKQIIEFFNIYKETLNKQFYLFYSYYGNIETYSGSGKDFVNVLQQNKLNKLNITKAPNDCCSICLDNEGTWVELNICKHKFHKDCINRIEIDSVYKCPICRTYN
jgi:hypothetical protein